MQFFERPRHEFKPPAEEHDDDYVNMLIDGVDKGSLIDRGEIRALTQDDVDYLLSHGYETVVEAAQTKGMWGNETIH